jgi:serine/threonine protein kinase
MTTAEFDYFESKLVNIEARAILSYFLNLYKFQIDAAPLDESHYEVVPGDAESKRGDRIIELVVFQDGRRKSRRMTIGLLGETVESKSICFKVIYDDVLVIKIPPQPISDFDDYIEGIDNERLTAARLAPEIECLTPKLTVILKKIPQFQIREELSPDQLEKRYIDWLKETPELQYHLKVNDKFVFFMSLSRYSFFNQAIDQPHQVDEPIKAEIYKASNLWNQDPLLERYGAENEPLFFSIYEVYEAYEALLKSVSRKHNLASPISPFDMKNWFIRYLQGLEIIENKEILSEAFQKDVNKIFLKLHRDHQEPLDNYKQFFVNFIHHKKYEDNHIYFSGVIANILNLIKRLHKNQIAVRDLKPDNMFVVGHVEESPLHLAASEEFTLGLIDLETAVDLKPADHVSDIEQPLLAGTPSYATPSHLYENDLLELVFGDLRQALHLQDMYASIGIIFAVATGELLFEKTGRLIPQVIWHKKRCLAKDLSLIDALKHQSWVFWHTAAQEFNNKTSAHRPLLQRLKIAIPQDVIALLKYENDNEILLIDQTLQSRVNAQKFFSNEKSRSDLIQSPPEAIRRLRLGWRKKEKLSPSVLKIKDQIVAFLLELERIKLIQAHQLEARDALTQAFPEISTLTVMEILFSSVLRFMYHPDWSERMAPQLWLTIYDRRSETPEAPEE